MNVLSRLNEFKYMNEDTINLYINFFETPLERRIRNKIWNDVMAVKAKKMKKSLWKAIGVFLFGEHNG